MYDSFMCVTVWFSIVSLPHCPLSCNLPPCPSSPRQSSFSLPYYIYVRFLSSHCPFLVPCLTHKYTDIYATLNTVMHVREKIMDIPDIDDTILKETHPPYSKAPNSYFHRGRVVRCSREKCPRLSFCSALPVQVVADTEILVTHSPL